MALKDVGVNLVVEGAGDFKSKLGGAESQITGLGNKILGNSKKIGIGMTAMGGAIVGGMGLAAKSFADFEAGMREVNTMMGLSEEELSALGQEVRNLSKDIGVDAVESTKALYQAISAGVPKENVMEFMKIASKAAIGGVTSTEVAVDGLTTVINAFKIPMEDAQKVADIMFTTVKGGKTTFEELSASMFNVAPMAALAGVKFEEVSGALATLTKQGVPTSVATTQLRAAIQAIVKPNKDMANAMSLVVDEMITSGEITGELADDYVRYKKEVTDARMEQAKLDVTTKEGKERFKDLDSWIKEMTAAMSNAASGMGPMIIQSRGLSGAFELLTGTAKGNTNEIAKMVGSVEGLGAVLGITGTNAETYAIDLANVQTATEGAGASTAAFNEVNKGAAQQWKIMQAQLKEIVLSIGQQLIPILTPLMEKVAAVAATVIAWIQQNPELTKTLVMIIGAIGGLMLVLGPLFMILPGIIAFLPILGAAFALLTGPVGLVILAITALIAIGILVVKNWTKISTFLKEVWGGLKLAASAVFQGIGQAIMAPINAAINLLRAIIAKVKAIPGIGKIVGALPGFAFGGTSTGGPTMVGERGPEMVSLPRGANVSPVNNNYNFNVSANYSNPQEPQNLAMDLDAMVLNMRS